MIRARQPVPQPTTDVAGGWGARRDAAPRYMVAGGGGEMASRRTLTLEMRFALLSVLAQAEGLGHLLTHPQS